MHTVFNVSRWWGLTGDAHKTPVEAGGSKAEQKLRHRYFSERIGTLYLFFGYAVRGKQFAYVFGLRLDRLTRNGSTALSLELRQTETVWFVKNGGQGGPDRSHFPSEIGDFTTHRRNRANDGEFALTSE